MKKNLKRYKISTKQNEKWAYWTRVATLEEVEKEIEEIGEKYEVRVIDTETDEEI